MIKSDEFSVSISFIFNVISFIRSLHNLIFNNIWVWQPA